MSLYSSKQNRLTVCRSIRWSSNIWRSGCYVWKRCISVGGSCIWDSCEIWRCIAMEFTRYECTAGNWSSNQGSTVRQWWNILWFCRNIGSNQNNESDLKYREWDQDSLALNSFDKIDFYALTYLNILELVDWLAFTCTIWRMKSWNWTDVGKGIYSHFYTSEFRLNRIICLSILIWIFLYTLLTLPFRTEIQYWEGTKKKKIHIHWSWSHKSNSIHWTNALCVLCMQSISQK